MKFILLEADKRPVIYQKILPHYVENPRDYEWLVDDAHQMSPKNAMWIVRSFMDNITNIVKQKQKDNPTSLIRLHHPSFLPFAKREWTRSIATIKDQYKYIIDWLSNRQRTGEIDPIDFKTLTLIDASSRARAWHNSLKASGRITDESGEVILKFDDGFYWINLHTNYCKEESDAMGHCGTVGAGQEILSLRESTVNGKQAHITAAVQRVIGQGWILYQLKGKGNSKPLKKYHKYIVDLLLLTNPIDIQRYESGYLPETDFNPSDLTSEEFKKLSQAKPKLVKDFESDQSK